MKIIDNKTKDVLMKLKLVSSTITPRLCEGEGNVSAHKVAIVTSQQATFMFHLFANL